MSMTRIIVVIFSMAMLAVKASPLQRVEPPFWWAGMKNQQLQLMLYGDALASYTAKIDYPGVTLINQQKLENKNYLILNLKLATHVRSGQVKIEFFHKNALAFSHRYPLKQRKEQSSERQGFNASDVIYLITPDRFANGDESNDSFNDYKDGLDRKRYDGRHGGDIKGVVNALDYIEAMGFTQIWLNPVLENAMPTVSYHGYSTTDYYQVDPRFGSNALYRELSKKARERGIGLIKDIILNHIGSEHWWMKDLPAKNWINHSDQFIETNHKRSAINDPHSTDDDRALFADGWFVKTMPDLNQRHPVLANYLIQNSIWWVEYADLSGIRLDTYSYSDKTFLTHYSKRLMAEYPRLNIVGEEWSTNPITVSYWQTGTYRKDGYVSHLPSLFDFPLQSALRDALLEEETWGTGLHKLYTTVATDYIYGNADNLVVMADNHDMDRVFTQLKHNPSLMKMAMVYLLTTRGIPQVFYGTEILMKNPGTGEHGVIRSDFPGGWKGDRQNAFTGKGLPKAQKEFQYWFKLLLNWRKNNDVIAKGKLIHYAPQKGIYVYFRILNDRKVMVVMNKNKQAIDLNLTRFKSVLGDKKVIERLSFVDVLYGKTWTSKSELMIEPESAVIFEVNQR